MATYATIPIRIVKNGGPITKDVYKSYYDDGGAANEDWKAGEILHLSATGKLARSDGAEGSGTYGTAATLDNDAPWDAAHRWFLALTDHDSNTWDKTDDVHTKGDSCAESQYVAVQEILSDTVLEIQCAASSSSAPDCTALLQGVDGYAMVVSASGVWGLDVDDASNGMFVLLEKQDDIYPSKTSAAVASTNGSGDIVWVRLVGNIIL